MRIGIDCRLWNESGVGRYTRNLVKELQEIDKKNEYVLFVLSKDFEKINSQLSTLNFQLRKADIRWHSIDEQLTFPGVLAREELDLMHFPYFSVPIFYTGKFVVTIHDLILHHYPTGQASILPPFVYNLKLLGYKFVIREAARKANQIISVSKTTKEEIVDHLDVASNKIPIIYEGIGTRITSNNAQYTGIPDIKSYFLYVGNVYPHKNVERLLGAFKLAFENKEVKLVMVGKEDYFYKKIKKLVAELKLEEKVVFTGYVSDEELNNLYKNAIATVVPSLMEGFSLPALEAMANKCLLLLSDIPVHREIAGDAALFFDPKDEVSISQKLKELVELPKSKFSSRIEKGNRRAIDFSWKKMAQKTVNIYESCVSIRPGE